MDISSKTIYLLLIIVCKVIVAQKLIKLKSFTSIIEDVRKLYVSPSFFIVYNRRQYGFERQKFLVEAIRIQSQKYSMSQAITYESLPRTTAQRNNVLHALLIRNEKNLRYAVNATRNIDMSLNPWLLLPSKNSGFDCDKPGDEFFNLKMDTRMTAKCEGNALLQKYFAIFDHKTEVINVAKWTSGRFLRFERTSLDLVMNMKGKTLHLAKRRDSDDEVNMNTSKFVMTVIKELASISKFHGKVSTQEDRMGHYDRKTNEWSGLMKIIKDGQADIGMVFFSQSKTRMNVVDFATSLVKARFYLYAKLPDSTKIRWDAYFQAFNKYTWMTTGIVLLIFPILLCMMNLQSLSASSFLRQLINVWGIFSQQGLAENPKNTPAQILSFSILILSLTIHAIYSASITSYITQLTADLPFSNYDEFFCDTAYSITVLKDSRDEDLFFENNNNQMSRLRNRLRERNFRARNPYEGFAQACEPNIVFYSDEVTYDGVKSPPCKLGTADMQHSEHMSFVLTKNSPYTKTISHLIFRLREHGILRRLKNKYFYKFTEMPKAQPNVIALEDILPILAILIVGAICALFVWLLEVTVHSFE